MKKKLFHLLTLSITAMLFGSCQLEDLFNLDKTITVNVTIEEGNIQANDLRVQTLSENISAEVGKSCMVKAFQNNKPQIIAVTDGNDKLLMLYRAPLEDGENIIINSNTTAKSLLTFDPLFGPVNKEDFNELINILTSSSLYEEYAQSVERAINRGADLTDTTVNAEMLAKLYNLFREICEQSYSNYLDGKKKTKDINEYIDCYPMEASTSGNTITLRTTGNCPSYYGIIRNGEGQKVADVCVPSRDAYGGMDAFRPQNTVQYGEPYVFNIPNPGNYEFELSRMNAAATTDFYLHLINNILGVLGASVDNNQIQALSGIVQRTMENHQFAHGGELSSGDVMEIIGTVYDCTVDYLSSSEQIFGKTNNWQLAGKMLKKLNVVYNVVKEATDAMMRLTWCITGIPEEVNFCVNYSQNDGIKSCLDINITIVGGNNQLGTAYQELSQPLRVYVRTRASNGMYIFTPQKVRFEVIDGDGLLSQTEVMSTDNGIAQTTWTLGAGTSGSQQHVRAVVVDDEGNEISNDVDFNAMVSNSRWRMFLRCDWASEGNWISYCDMDIAPESNGTGIIPLAPQSCTGWDYDGATHERYNISGTYNKANAECSIIIAMYTTADNHHFRSDRYTFTLSENGASNVIGNLIYDDGAGCVTAIDITPVGSSTAPQVQTTHGTAPRNIPIKQRSLRNTNN